ncbi:MAG: hypothetical protein MUO60_11660 [Clostridiaceae bacterium]|nr:hypothetical protein [Clostridiaceae bacterium]
MISKINCVHNLFTTFEGVYECNEFAIKNIMLKEFRLTEYSLHQDVKSTQHTFKNNVDSFTA